MQPLTTTNIATSTVIVTGTLMIRDIPKRAGGSFKVGKLSTHIGQFEVKNPELDQYEAGTYSGNFCIDKIYPSHYVAGGKIVIEMRAVLSCFVLAGFDEDTGEVENSIEVDPIDEETSTVTVTPVATVVEAAEDVAPASGDAAPVADDDASTSGNDAADTDDTKVVMSVEEERAFREQQMDKDTFGEVYPLTTEVKLDVTVGRTKLRAQCDRLKSLGYKFVAARQVWIKAD
ncbi:DUF3275 family protein [Thiothrix unzii]|jgi:CBS domain-containing protein|uniref:DUF3275 family protein n=1 Tax=Thiothrix unzii TaxID=111769 RepID=UPI002A369EFA|nr:DUF3275 family protein [Thiothrix unzii]MDX9987468.1 DUF3275 family protein [Thiothrix unzii]